MDAALGKIGMKLAIGAHFCGPFGGEMLSFGKSVNFVPFWTLFCGPFHVFWEIC